MKSRLSILLLFFYFTVNSQILPINYKIDIWANAGGGEFSPFWFHNNNYDLTSKETLSNSTLLSFSKDSVLDSKIFDFDFKLSYLNQINSKTVINRFHEYYVQGRLYFLDLYMGAKQNHIGPQDKELSSGGFLLSDNYQPIPQIHAGIFDYTALPYTYGLVEVKGGLAHGWFVNNLDGNNILLHHKYFHLRLGGSIKHKIAYGFDHAAQWGGSLPGYGVQNVNWSNYKTVFFAGHGGADATRSDQINRLGNHLVSQHLQYEGEFGDFKANVYWQTISEDSPIRLPWLAINWKDGLWGITLENKNLPVVQKFCYEFIQTLDQSGPWHDKDGIVFGGSDSYFTGAYPTNWSYAGRTLATPLVLSPFYNPGTYPGIVYNDLRAHHAGLMGRTGKMDYKMLATWISYYPSKSLPVSFNQAYMIQISKSIQQGYNFGLKLGYDRGDLIGNNFGMMLTVGKSGSLTF